MEIEADGEDDAIEIGEDEAGLKEYEHQIQENLQRFGYIEVTLIPTKVKQ